MRFSIHDIDALKRKAKFLKKYLGHPFIGRPDIALGAIQRTLAVGLGYTDWAELTIISKRNHADRATSWHSPAFHQLSKALEGLAGINGCLADALTFRMGFSPDGNLRTPAAKTGFPNLRYADLLLDRLLEVDARSRDALIIRQAMTDVYDRVIEGFGDGQERGDWESRKAAAEWIETIAIWMGWKIESWRNREASFRQQVKYIPINRIVNIAEQLPSRGLLVMSGCFGSGRSTTPRLLSLALRRGRTTMFHMASELRPDAIASPHGVYRDEMRSIEKFSGAVKDVDAKLVMVQLGAASSGAAYALMMWYAKSLGLDIWKDWLGTNLVGGVHHDWSFEERPGLVQCIEQWWRKDAIVSNPSREYPDGYVTFRETKSLG